MKNISPIISAHNKNIINPNTKSFGCTCRVEEHCPLNEECLTPMIIYRAIVKNREAIKYIGLADTPFKDCYRNNTKDFNKKEYINNTELAKYVWSFKERSIIPIIKWEISSKVYGNTKKNICKLRMINSINGIFNCYGRIPVLKDNEHMCINGISNSFLL